MFATLQDVGDNKLGKPVPSKKHDMHHPFIMDVSPEHLEHLPPKQTDILHGMAFSELPRCVPFRNKLPALQNLEGQNYSQKMWDKRLLHQCWTSSESSRMLHHVHW